MEECSWQRAKKVEKDIMDNRKYLQQLGVPSEAQQKCLDAMSKYNENHWWESDVDPRKLAYYQMHEDFLLTNFSHFHGVTRTFVYRSSEVFTHEMGISADALRQEAERAWIYQVGVTSDAESQERMKESIEHLQQWAKEHGKEFISIEIPENK